MKCAQTPFLHNFSNFVGILFFPLIYMYFALLLQMIRGCFWPENIMVSPFLSAGCKSFKLLSVVGS